MKIPLLFLLSSLLVSLWAENPMEIGKVNWGKDAEILKRFQEPAWNFQVVRFLNEEGKDWIEREEGVWTREALAKRMKIVLEKSKNSIPTELKFLSGEKRMENKSERVAFAQSCFWTGEMRLGGVEGVTQTDQKRQLQGTSYERLSLTPEQATKINAFVRTEPEKVLDYYSGN